MKIEWFKSMTAKFAALAVTFGLACGAWGATEVGTWADLVSAANSGGEIVLTGDITADWDSTIELSDGQSVVLDLAGHKISVPSDWFPSGLISIGEGVSFVIKGGGMIDASSRDEDDSFTLIDNYGTMEIKSGVTIRANAASYAYALSCGDDATTIVEDGVVLEGYVYPDGFKFATDGKTVAGKHTVSGGHVVVESSASEPGSVVAKIGDTEYTSLGAAITAVPANGAETTIVVQADTVLDATVVIPAGKKVILDLNGKAITVPNAAPHIYAIRNNGTIALTDSKGSGSISARGVYNGPDNTSAKMTVEGGSYYNLDTDGGAAIFNKADLTVNGGTFNGVVACLNNSGSAAKMVVNGATANGYTNYAVQNNGGTVTINDITVNGKFGAFGQWQGTSATTINGGTFAIIDNTYAGKSHHCVYVGAGDLTINGGAFTNGDNQADSGLALCMLSSGTATITGGTFVNLAPDQFNETISLWGGSGTFAVSGGTFNRDVKDDYLVEGATKTNNGDGTWTVTPPVPPVAQVVSADGTTTNKYEDLHAALEAGKAQGSVVTLLADVDLTGVAWTPVGSTSSPFCGTFDGDGHTIGNLTFDNATATALDPDGDGDGWHYLGLFGYAENAAFADLVLTNVNISASVNRGYYGSLVGYEKNSAVSNVDVDDVSIFGEAHIGAVIGYAAGGSVTGCDVTGLVILTESLWDESGFDIGGIVGKVDIAQLVLNNCTVSGDSGSFVKSEWGAGGLLGYTGPGMSGSVSGCSVSGLTIEATSWGGAGGLMGFARGGDTITGCTVSNVTVIRTDSSTPTTNLRTSGLIVGCPLNTTSSKPLTMTNCTMTDSIVYRAAKSGEAGYSFDLCGDDGYSKQDGQTGNPATTSESGNTITFTSVAAIGTTFYATFADAIAAVQDGQTIVVINYNAETMIAPEGWEFVTEDGVTTLVRKVYVAQIGDDKYETLAAAIADAQGGDTILLLQDVTLGEAATVSKSLTITLDGHSITGTITAGTGYELVTSDTAYVVRGAGYAGEVLPAGPDMSGDVINVTAANAQYTLDGAYGDITGKTINFTENITERLDLGRCTKYAGSGTTTSGTKYTRTLSNVTFTSSEGVTIAGFTADSGHVYQNSYDYVRDQAVTSTNNGYYKYSSLTGITFEGLTVSDNIFAIYGLEGTICGNITFDGCTFTGNTSDTAPINFNNTGSFQYGDITIQNCTINGSKAGIYINGGAAEYTIKNNYVVAGNNNAIQLWAVVGSAATVDIEGNFLKSDKYTVNLYRFESEQITLTGNAVVAGARGHLGHFQGDASGNFWAPQGATPDASGNMNSAMTEPIADTGAAPGENDITSSSYYSTAVVDTSAAQWVTLSNLHKFVAQVGDVKYTSFADAIAAANTANVDEITILNGATESPDADWKIVDGKLVRKTYVAQIGSTKYETLADAITAAQAGDTVQLLRDVNLAGVTINLNKGLTLDGDGHDLTTTASAKAIYVNTSDAVTIKNLTIPQALRGVSILPVQAFHVTVSNVTMLVSQRGITFDGGCTAESELNVVDCEFKLLNTGSGTESAYINGEHYRGISAWDSPGATFNITDCKIDGFAYDINVAGDHGSSTFNIAHSEFSGRAMLNVWSSGNTFNVTDCEINGYNTQTGPTERFGSIVANNGSSVANNNIFNINQCRFTANLSQAASSEGGNASQQMFAIRGYNSTVTIRGNTVSYEAFIGTDTAEPTGRFGLEELESHILRNTFYLDTAATNDLEAVLAALTSVVPLAVTEGVDGAPVTGVKLVAPVASFVVFPEGERKFATFADAIAAANEAEIDTITILDGTTTSPDSNWKVENGLLVRKVYVAQIGAVKYESLAEAVTAATAGATIEIIADDAVSLTGGANAEITINKALTITGAVDESGEPLYTIYGTYDATGSNDIFVTGSGNVTISKVKFAEFGNEKAATDPGSAPIYVSTGYTGEITLDTVTISDFNRGGIFLYGGSFVVTNCYIDCAKDIGSALTKGIEIKGTASGTIVDTLICNMERDSSSSSAGIEIYSNGNIVVDNVTIISDVDDHTTTKATYGIVVNHVGEHDPSGGNLLVTNCSFSCSNGCLAISDGDEGNVLNYSAMVVDCSFDNYVLLSSSGSTITINGGDYAEDLWVDNGAITVLDGEFGNFAPYTEGTGTIAISGGFFDRVVPEKYCAENYMPTTTPDENDMYTVVLKGVAKIGDTYYQTFAEAIAVADATLAETGVDPVIMVVDANAEQANPDWKIDGDKLVRKVYVAQIGTTKYETLAEAFAAVKDGETIQLIADVTDATMGAKGIVASGAKTVTLDLAGFNATCTDGSAASNRMIKIADGLTLNVVNTAETQSVMSVLGDEEPVGGTPATLPYGVFRAEVGTTLNINGGEGKNIKLVNGQAWGLNVKLCGATATLSNIEIESTYGGGIEVTEADLGASSQAGYAELTGCVFTQTGYYDHCSTALSVSGGSELVVNSGTYTSENYGIYVFSSGGRIVVRDGTFEGAGKAVVKAEMDTNTYPAYTGAVQISGGRFTGALNVLAPASLSITGGYFSTPVADGYCASGYLCTTRPVKDELYQVVPAATVTFTGAAPEGVEHFVNPETITFPSGDAAQVALPLPTYTYVGETNTTFVGWTNAAGVVYASVPAGTTESLTLGASWTSVKTVTVTESEVDIKVTDDWIAQNVTNEVSEATTEEIQTALNKEEANGNKAWENYVLGLDGSDPNANVAADAAQGPVSATPITSNIEVPKVDTGFKVEYKLVSVDTNGTTVTQSALQPTPDLTADIASMTSEKNVVYYKTVAVIKSTDPNKDVTVEVPSTNTIGVLKVESGAATTAVAVPWASYDGTNDISVADIVRTANLTPANGDYDGDELKAYDKEADKYKAWRLSADRTWVPAPVVGGSSEIGADAYTVKRGSAVWLTRADPSQPIYLVGGVAATEKAKVKLEAGTTTNPSWNLVGSAGTEPVEVTALLGDNHSDKVSVPTATVPKNYEYVDGKWGYRDSETYVHTNKAGRVSTRVRDVFVTDDNYIPAGTGFWYKNSGTEKQIDL